MSPRNDFFSTVPRKSQIIFLLGVFLIFSSLAIAGDMSEMGRQPITRFVLHVLLISSCAVGYAVAGFTMRSRAWKVMVPLFLLQGLLINFLHRWFPSATESKQLDPAALAGLQSRLNIDMAAIIAVTFLGYCCFVFATVAEGRRYFRAHAEIALAREIHQVLVPVIDTTLDGFAFYGESSPSAEVLRAGMKNGWPISPTSPATALRQVLSWAWSRAPRARCLVPIAERNTLCRA